jgi:hypothetical protein
MHACRQTKLQVGIRALYTRCTSQMCRTAVLRTFIPCPMNATSHVELPRDMHPRFGALSILHPRGGGGDMIYIPDEKRSDTKRRRDLWRCSVTEPCTKTQTSLSYQRRGRTVALSDNFFLVATINGTQRDVAQTVHARDTCDTEGARFVESLEASLSCMLGRGV